MKCMQNQIALGVFAGRQRRAHALLRTVHGVGNAHGDGQENPITTIQSSKFYEVQP